MNKEYICDNGKVLVKDENNNERVIEYSDNLDKILVQENVIELLEKRLNVLRCSNKKFQNYKISDTIPGTLVMLGTSFSVVFPILLLYRLYTLNGVLEQGIINLITNMSITGFIVLGISGIITILKHLNYKKYKKVNQIALDLTEKKLVLEKQKLNKLQQEKNNIKEDKEFKTDKVNDVLELKKLRNCLELFYNLGINEKKYLKYFENEKLDKIIDKYYTKEDVSLIEDYFNEKVPVLVKKR